MTYSVWRHLKWPDGLRGRFAAALLLALLVQFVGSDIIFERIEARRVEQGNAQRLADWLVFADQFAVARPEAVANMNAMWSPLLTVGIRQDAPADRSEPDDDRTRRVEELVLAARPALADLRLDAASEGRDLTGSIRLRDGEWLTFTSEGYFDDRSHLVRYMANAFVLLLSVALAVILFGRMIGQPLARIAKAADRVGYEEAVSPLIEGPREVRKVAAAFDRMQLRLTTMYRDRLQSIAAMSHDLRTPLTRMRLNAAGIGDGELREAIEEDVRDMEGFVESVMEYLRGEDPEAEQRVDIASILMTVIDEAKDRNEDAQYSGPDRLECVTRPLKLKRIVRNLVENATRHAGNAHVTLSQQGDTIRIAVEDDGPGVPDAEIASLFVPFHRLEQSRSRSTGGSGLGLAIVERLVERVRGTITLANRPAGGLIATVLIPANAAADMD